ncbi:MAG: sugar phosphate isomerase [Lentisphaerae bacterium]|nr:sugar phosphate isomerase [Lentisphaerota bacterium]
MSTASKAAAADFIKNETQFHLGFLPTEQSHPRSVDLEKNFRQSTVAGVKTLQDIDRDVLVMAQKVLKSREFEKFVNTAKETLSNGGRMIFSGCGATGRLAILLESMWRDAASRIEKLSPFADNAASIMTGGDYALVRAVEFFEDYPQFGRKQVEELAVTDKDMLIAITEGGETSSVLGTLAEAVERGAGGFLLFNNPADILAEKLERSRNAITDPRVTVLDLTCGPMALAGSTRMQATTSEQLIAGSMLETLACSICGLPLPDFAAGFAHLLDELDKSAENIANFVDLESACYSSGGRITYYADCYLLDIFTDTAERTPTFMLTPFKKIDDEDAPEPWALAKSLCYTADEIWQKSFKRAPRCLNWNAQDYIAMNGTEKMIANPPQISFDDMLQFDVGCEINLDRCSNPSDTAVLVAWENEIAAQEFEQLTFPYPGRAKVVFSFDIPETPLLLMRHLAVKLFFNTLSTGTMVKMGRVSGNWMSFVDTTNKKLIDRAVRLISELGKMDYQSACELLFEAKEQQLKLPLSQRESPVQMVLKKLPRCF